jgi:NADH-quinone oxidoreductase subunit M
MILVSFILILMVGGLLAWVSERSSSILPKWISLSAVIMNLIMSLFLWKSEYASLSLTDTNWLIDYAKPWIPSFGIGFHLAMDGLSLLMIVLTSFLGLFAVLCSWKEIEYKVGFYYFNLLWVLAGITGVFLVMDLFLFYFFWEVMLVPMYFLISIWGHENRKYAAYKFFIFTQASGLMMLLAILGLYFVHAEGTGIYTFDYFQLLNTSFPSGIERWLMLGFLVAFVVKLPVIPFHSWLPDAHSQAPTAGSLILAGLLLKTGAYGLLRFVLPLFPEASHEIAYGAMLVGVIGILYGGKLAFSQTDLKRLVAYTSVSHMGFVMLGVFAFNEWAYQGVVMQMITHGISTGALFVLAGQLYERIHTRDVEKMGGFWKKMPFMGTIALIFAMASLGLPGLGNFVAEFLTLIGSWQSAPVLTILSTIGLVIATAYSLRIVKVIFLEQEHEGSHALPDLSLREKVILIPLVVSIILLGVYPQPVLNTAKKSIERLSTKHHPVEKEATTLSTIETKGGSHD